MVIGEYLAVLKKWWWLLAASVLVASVSSYAAVSRAPRIYQATTTVIVGQSLQKANPTYQDFTISQQLAQTYLTMVQRQPILAAAAEALSLPYVPWAGNVSARIVPGTQLLEIGVRDTAPERARLLADEIARQLILQTPTDSAENRERRDFVEGQLKSLERNIQETLEDIEEEQAKLDAANSARAIQQYQSNIVALQQKLASYQSTYASLAQTAQGGTNYISVVEPAVTPTRPISPQVMETVLTAAAIGLALALGGVFLIEFLDDTVKTPNDATRTANLPLLGTIARIAGDVDNEGLIARRDPQSPVSESFRALRTNIQFTSLDRPIRTLMVTSPDPVEGKSLIIENLALVMAQGGLSVILVDADLRRPMQHARFGLNNARGLSNALLESDPDMSGYGWRVPIDGLAEAGSGAGERQGIRNDRPAGTGALYVITSGPVPPNPADLVASKRMQALIAKLESLADIVLFDAPPVLAATDAVMLSTRVDGVLVVNDHGHTRRARAQQAVERLRQVDANLLGMVLNRVPSRGESYYRYDYYYYASAGSRQGARGPRRDHDRRKFALLGLVRKGSRDDRPRPGRPRWWRKLRPSANHGPAAQPQEPGSLNQWVREYGGRGDHAQDSRQRQATEEPETQNDEDSEKTQPIQLDASLLQEPEGQGGGKRKKTRPLQLDAPLPPEPEGQGEGKRKKTRPLQLDAPLPPEPETHSEGKHKKTQRLQLDAYPFPEPETQSSEESQIEPPTEGTSAEKQIS